MARKGHKTSALSNNIHGQIKEQLSRELDLQHQHLNQLFIQKLENLMQRLEWRAKMQETSMLAKMKLAQIDGTILDSSIQKAFVSSVIAGQQDANAFKELTMLTHWYQQELISLEKKTATTSVVLETKGKTITIATLDSKIQDTSSSALIDSFSSLFTLDRAAASKGGGYRARYKTSQRALKSAGYEVKQVQTGRLEKAYYEILRRSKAMKTATFKDSAGKNTRLAGGASVIPVKTANGVKYYNLSSLGDMKEAYLGLHLQKGYLQGDASEQDVIDILEAASTRVSNTSGLIIGDISTASQEIAVKSAGASAMGIQQIIDYIYGLRSMVQIGGTRNKAYDNFSSLTFRQQNEETLQYETSQEDITIPDEAIGEILERDIFNDKMFT